MNANKLKLFRGVLKINWATTKNDTTTIMELAQKLAKKTRMLNLTRNQKIAHSITQADPFMIKTGII